MRRIFASGIIWLASSGAPVFGVGYFTDFEGWPSPPPGGPLTEVAGTDGWVINDGAPYLSFIAPSPVDGSNMGALGGFYEAPTGRSILLSHAAGLPMARSRFQTLFALGDSTANYPEDDEFGFMFRNGVGDNLFTLWFVPDPPDPDPSNEQLWAMRWQAGDGPREASGFSVFDRGAFLLDLDFHGDGDDIVFQAMVGAPGDKRTFGGVLPGLGGEEIGDFGLRWEVTGAAPVDAGDNVLLVDNIGIGLRSVPDGGASVALLGMGLLALGIVGRRFSSKH